MDIASLLGNYAFPIVACIIMAVYVKNVSDNARADTKELNSLHSQEMLAFKDEIKEALNNNTTALIKLCDKIEGK